MKKLLSIFLALPILAVILLYLPILWFIGAVAILLIFIVYRFYNLQLETLHSRNELLQIELDDIHMRLETAVLKEQMSKKESEQAKQLKQELLSVLSHEIRTPLNGVLGMVLLLQDTILTKDQIEYTNTIRTCGENLLTSINDLLIDDILEFSKLHQEVNKLEYKEFDLRDTIEEVLDLFSNKIDEKVELFYDIDVNVPEQIIGDSKRLRQVLINLIENSVKFTQAGNIIVDVHFTPSITNGVPSQLIFEIKDTGIGITNDQLKQLFKGLPGKENHKENKTETNRLGLVICKKLVEMMGGEIEARSEPGNETIFTFNLPFTRGTKSIRKHSSQYNMINLEGKQVLIVDNNERSRAILTKQLKAWKMLPVSVDSANSSLELLLTTNFDVILVDINMHLANGTDLAKTVMNDYPTIPVILMKHGSNKLYTQKPGVFFPVMDKPIRQHQLKEQILNALSQKKSDLTTTEPLSEFFAQKYPLHILIAEDNHVNQKIATKILNKLGYKPLVANNGKEVMEMVSLDHYDLILMDILMPEMDGLEATRMIRTCLEIQPVIIAMTANVMPGDRDKCMQADMDDYMSKPIELPELLSQLEKWAIVIRERRKISA